MFTGIVQSLGRVTQIEHKGVDCSIYFDCAQLCGENIALGDSIAVNGCCLTVVDINQSILKVDVSGETLNKTSLNSYQPDTLLNLELAMLPQTRFGGHIVSGHIDCVGEITSIESEGRSVRFDIALEDFGKFIAEKGSITVDGVSLTVNEVTDKPPSTHFTVNIIPHTFESTLFHKYIQGDQVNIEIDLIARYLQRLNQFSVN